MISILDLSNDKPYLVFKRILEEAVERDQRFLEVAAISSYNKAKNEVESRYVNLKYIIKDEWIFFSNYKSVKAKNFQEHNQISVLLYWEKINVQIRLKALIEKTSAIFSDEHYDKRDIKKNIIAHISNQSNKIDSYEALKYKFENSSIDYSKRPNFWGGYSFKPYYFEFWKGNEYRMNKREIFESYDGTWKNYYLEP